MVNAQYRFIYNFVCTKKKSGSKSDLNYGDKVFFHSEVYIKVQERSVLIGW
jgi:hypothetical protein